MAAASPDPQHSSEPSDTAVKPENLHGHWANPFPREILIASQNIQAHSKGNLIFSDISVWSCLDLSKAVFQSCLSSKSHSLEVGTL